MSAKPASVATRSTSGGARKTLLPADGLNPLAMASRVLADEWNLWILWHALAGARRFGDWKDSGAIPNAALSNGLSELTDSGLFVRVRYQTRPDRFEYVLTPRGRSVWPALVGIWWWERTWGQVPERPAFEVMHTRCDSVLEPRTACRVCTEPLVGRDLQTTVGPSGGWLRSIPDVANRRRATDSDPSAREFPETMTLIGDRWSWAVLGAAFRGVTRRSEFMHFLGGPPPTLTERLRAFVSVGVMDAVPDPARRGWFDYRLTTKGRAFLPVVLATVEWGQLHYRSPDGPALVIRHRTCGRVTHPLTLCGVCGEVVALGDLRTTPVATSRRSRDRSVSSRRRS